MEDKGRSIALALLAVIIAASLIYYNFFRPSNWLASIPELDDLKVSVTEITYENETLKITWSMNDLGNTTYRIDTCIVVIEGHEHPLSFTPTEFRTGDSLNISVGATGLFSGIEFDAVLLIKDCNGTLLGKVTNHVALS